MAGVFRFDEKPTSGAQSLENPSITKLYTLCGITDHAAAFVYARGATATMIAAAGQVLYRQDVRLDHVGYDVWDVVVPYGPLNKSLGEYRFSYSTLGGSVLIRQAKEHIAVFPAGKPDNKGAIDVQNGEAQGTEIVIPSLKFTYAVRHPTAVINEAHGIRMARLTGKTNSKAWHGMKPGEALFLGSNGSDGTNSEAEATYEVAASEEMSNATIGTITGVNKKGWEVAWCSFKDAVDGGKPVRQLDYISIERVFDSFDFAAELGF